MERAFVDQFSDPSFRGVVRILQQHPELTPLVKTAEMDLEANEHAPDSAFAWPERRLFRIDTPEHAILSRTFIEKQAAVPVSVREQCAKALALFGIEFELEKEAAAEDLEEYLLPEHKRFRVVTKEDVKLAAEAILYHQRQMSTETRARASTNLVKKAVDLDVDEPLPATILKFAGATMCNTRCLSDWLGARSVSTHDPGIAAGYEKLAQDVRALPPLCGDRDELIKVAGVIRELDRAAGLEKYYDRTLLDPLQAVFNTDKVADDLVELAGQPIPMETLLSIDPEVYRDTFGLDLADAFIEGDTIDPENLKVILPTVPYDLQKTLRSQLGQ